MKELTNYILQFGNLAQAEIDLISAKVREMELPKDKYLLEAGKIPLQVGFLVEGILRVCYFNDEGEEVTLHFVHNYNFAVNWNSFQKGIAAPEYVQAVTDCKLFVLSKQAWEELRTTIAGWESIASKIIQKTLAQKLEKRSSLVGQDATSRYLSFLKQYPGLVNRIPLSYVASYLGITQSSLSRIRKKIR